MNIPNSLRYSKTHEWVKTLENGNVLVGIDDYAQNQLSDIVFVNICEVGDEIIAGVNIGDVESVKAVSDVTAPVSGTVVKVNNAVLDDPSLINQSPYDAWLIEIADAEGFDALYSAEEYAQTL